MQILLYISKTLLIGETKNLQAYTTLRYITLHYTIIRMHRNRPQDTGLGEPGGALLPEGGGLLNLFISVPCVTGFSFGCRIVG